MKTTTYQTPSSIHNLSLDRNTKTIQFLRELGVLAKEETDPLTFIRSVCSLLVNLQQYKNAWCVLFNGNGEIVSHGAVGLSRSLTALVGRLQQSNLPCCAGKALAHRNTVFMEGPSAICRFCALSDECEDSCAYCSCLTYGSRVYGVLSVAISSNSPTYQEEMMFLETVAANVSLMLHAAETEKDKIDADRNRKESQQQLELALKGANLGLWDWNLLTGDVRFSGQWPEILNCLPDGTEFQINSWDSLIHPGDMPRVETVLKDHIEGKTPFYESEHRLKTRTGEWKWVLDRGRIVEFENDGTPVRATGTILDISARKMSEEERENLEVQLRQAQKIESIGRLAGGIAHDLNNLLSPIIGYSEMVLFEIPEDEPMFEDVAQIREAAHRAKELTQQLLAFSRKQVLRMKAVDLNEIVLDSKSMLRRLIREDIKVDFEIQPEIGSVMADSTQIQQILMNLALNAGDSMPNGGKMTIGTSNVFLDEEFQKHHPVIDVGDYVLLSVSDVGIGMDEETISRIFEPFYSTKEKGRGTGLGLATVYGIVKQHGGYIWAYSEPEQGSIFKVYLPRTKNKTSKRQALTSKPVSAYGSERILVVEDEHAVRKLTCKILRKQGYDILEAESATHALQYAANPENPIQLLLTDIVMPDMNGKELYTNIQKIRPEVKVLYMSGYTNDVIAHHGILDKGIRFLQKPFSVDRLTKKIRKALDE